MSEQTPPLPELTPVEKSIITQDPFSGLVVFGPRYVDVLTKYARSENLNRDHLPSERLDRLAKVEAILKQIENIRKTPASCPAAPVSRDLKPGLPVFGFGRR